MAYQLTVDAGGTFTEGVLTDERDGAVRARVRATSREPAGGTLNCLGKLASAAGTTLSELLARTATITWGTTLAADVLAARSGAKVATLASLGFRTRLFFPPVSNVEDLEPSAPLVVPQLMTEVPERVTADGSTLVPLDEESVREAVRFLKKQQVEAVAVLFLFSPLHPAHERRAAEIIAEEHPAAHVALSSTVSQDLGEFDRWSRAVRSAYVGPAVSKTVAVISAALLERGFHGELLFRRADGGTATAEELVENPVVLLPPSAATGPLSPFKSLLSIELDGRNFELRFHAGSDGREGRDGRPGAGFVVAAEDAFWRDVEPFETHCPVLVEELTVAQDGEGAGKFRGGPGATLEFVARTAAVLAAGNSRGSSDVASQETVCFGPDGLMQPLRFPDRQPLVPGDRCLVRCSGGEGWGDPLERATARVQADVIEGLVSVQRARDVYGVVLNPATLEVQCESTRELREELRARRG